MSDDFFTNVPLRRSRSPPSDSKHHDDFAHAISLRFGSADLRTARLLPDRLPKNNTLLSPQPQPQPPPRPNSLSPTQQSFSSILPSSLYPCLHDPRTLILDIRPHAAHAAARIINAISLSVPTTLLKRPLFSLSKLSQMLPSPSSRARFSTWPSASCILVYDSDSVFSPDNSIIAGLLRKFRSEGFVGELGWVRGGFQAVWREARDLTTTDHPPVEEDEPDLVSTSGALRTSQLPKAAFSLVSTTAVPSQHPSIPGAYPLPNTPAPSASRAANPFFDTIRQNVELSHGITERIPLRLPRRIRRRIHDLPFQWLQDIARRSALRHPSASRHPGLESLESGSESSDDPHTSDPDENDPNVEEGTEALAMQFYRIELAEQRRLRSIMEHHTKESELGGLSYSAKAHRSLEKVGASVPSCSVSGPGVRVMAKSVPGTPHPVTFPFSITAGVEKGTKNRYTHIWPFEHARVRLHDGRHQGSHLGKRDKSRASERGRSTRDRAIEPGKDKDDQGAERDRHHRSRSSPALGKNGDQDVSEVITTPSRCFFYPDPGSPIAESKVKFGAELSRPALGPNVPQVKIEYDIAECSRISTPATALPLPTPPFYTPMEISPAFTPMYSWSPQPISLSPSIDVSQGGRLGTASSALSVSGFPTIGPYPSFPLRLPNRPGRSLPSIGEQGLPSELLPSAAPSGSRQIESIVETAISTRTRRDERREPSPADDYVNASYVQPLGTRKRYIATQGPLPSTYVDFWTLVWEQNVHVIVMLTREVENAMVKCGSYWTDAEYGPLKLELLFTSPPKSPVAGTTSTDVSKQGFFTIREPQAAAQHHPTLITRVFALRHASYPGVPPRRITHLQYLDWSDMNVPDDPRGVLDLIKKLEQAVTESTPGPSPSGSLSPGSASGSLSDSQSPDVGPGQKGYDTLLSPTSAGFIPRRGRRRGSEWRHPELDSKTGIAAFALGKPPPVLLHCSAGVGRTGGFIAVDAVLDGIRRELQRDRETRNLKTSGVNVVVSTDEADVKEEEASGEFSIESTEAGANTAENSGESILEGSECMDVDQPAVEESDEPQVSLCIVNTVPIPVSAGDRSKGRRRHYSGEECSDEKARSSSEPLVMHVPYVGVSEEGKVANIDFGDPKVAGWQSSSTREWVEQVSDQTHTHTEETDRPPPSLGLSSRERSPGSASNSSGPSVLNSADSINGSIGANASGSASISGSGSGNPADRRSGTGSGSGSRRQPPSSAWKTGSESMSHSNSGSGTGTGSRLGSSLLRVRLHDSSATSVSAGSTDLLSPRPESKLNASLHRSPRAHSNSSSDMEIDHPQRPVSAPLQSVRTNTMVLQAVKPSLGSSPVASFSSPDLPPGPVDSGTFFIGDAAGGLVPRLDPDALTRPSQKSQCGESANAEAHGRSSQLPSDERSFPVKSRSNLRLNTDLISLRIPETIHHSRSAKTPPLLSFESRDRENAAIPLSARAPSDSISRQFLLAGGNTGASDRDLHSADLPIIDYKLPRELHSDLSPPLISSFAEPICTVIQDMREQRMSLCQSLRQYIFVHAAIIEGALRIVDEERELWGFTGTSDDASSAEEDPGATVRKDGKRYDYGERAGARFGGLDEAEVAVRTPEIEYSGTRQRTHPLHIPMSSPSGVSSPSKGKRGPSPTELLKEDKTGALSLNKRPSIHRQTAHREGTQHSNNSSPVTSEGGSRGAGMGRLEMPERGDHSGDDRVNFE